MDFIKNIAQSIVHSAHSRTEGRRFILQYPYDTKLVFPIVFLSSYNNR